MTQYFLPEDVYFCPKGDALIFLCLKKDQYLKVQGEPALLLSRASLNTEAFASPEDANTVSQLIAAGLLTTEARLGKAILPSDVLLPEMQLSDLPENTVERLRFGHFWNFVCACIGAALALRFQSIEQIVKNVQQRKAAMPQQPLDVQRARALVMVFNTLRLLFPRRFLCRFDSLALLKFLARYDIFPMWVFAVKLDPWGAHCWVQADDILLNEEIDEAEEYIPVMAI